MLIYASYSRGLGVEGSETVLGVVETVDVVDVSVDNPVNHHSFHP